MYLDFNIKFIELFKNWGYKHLRSRVLENLQDFSELTAEHSGKKFSSLNILNFLTVL